MAGRGPQLLRASLQADGASERLAGRRVVGFAGIGRPAKFFATLGEIGCQVMECHEFSDHYRYDQRDLDHLAGRAAVLDAVLVTTAKDGVRLPPKARESMEIVEVAVVWGGVEMLDSLLEGIFKDGP